MRHHVNSDEFNILKKFSFADLEEMITVAEDAQEKFRANGAEYTDETRFHLMLYVAKLISNIANENPDDEVKNKFIDKSLKMYDQIIEQSGLSDLIGVSCHDSSVLLLSIFQFEEAEKRQIRAVEMARAENDKLSEARRQANYAQFLRMRGKIVEAHAEFEESMKVLLAVNDYWDERWANMDTSP